MKRIEILQCGIGGVGEHFLKEVLRLRGSLQETHGVDLVFQGLVRRGKWFRGDPERYQGIPDAAAWVDGSIELALGEFAEPDPSLKNAALRVLVDVTACDTTDFFLRALGAGISVVTANKIPLARKYEEFWAMQVAAWRTQAKLGYECTVGASLPVIGPLSMLAALKDHPTSIQGSLSGTLGVLMAGLDQGKSFSEAVRFTKENGISEPDPRIDLGGLDVARKALILARTQGWPFQPDQVEAENLVPQELEALSIPAFLKELSRWDEPMRRRHAEAQSKNHTLRYLARVSRTGIRVGLEEVPIESAWGQLHEMESRVEIFSARYEDTPLIIQGPGAGPLRTAQGVLEDVLRVAS